MTESLRVKKVTLNKWLKDNHPEIFKDWEEMNKEKRRKYAKVYMQVKYYNREE